MRRGDANQKDIGDRGRSNTGAIAIAGLVALLAVFGVWRYHLAPAQPVGAVNRLGSQLSVNAGPGWGRDPAVDTFAVSPDGASLAFVARGADGVSSIWLQRFSESSARRLDDTDEGMQPFWSPDGRQIGFFQDASLMAAAPEGATPRRIARWPPGERPLGGLWFDDTIVFALAGRGLFSVPAAGGTLTALAMSGRTAQRSALSWPQVLPQTDHLIVYATTDVDGGSVSLFPVSGGAATPLVQSAGAASYVSGVLLFPQVGTNGVREIVQRPFDLSHTRLGSSQMVIRTRVTDAVDGAPGFSVAGAVLSVQPIARAPRQLQWIDRSGRTTERIGPEEPIDDFALAADGQRIVVTIRDAATGVPNLWLIDDRSGEPDRLTTSGGRSPIWSSDGQQIFYSMPADGEPRVITVDTGASEAFPLSGPPSQFEDATRDGRYLILRTTAGMPEIWLQRVDDPSEHRTLIKGDPPMSSARVSPNGKWLAFTRVERGRRDVFVQPFDLPGTRIKVSEAGGDHPVWRDDSRELFYESQGALLSVSVADDRGLAVVGAPERIIDLRTTMSAGGGPRNVAVAGAGPRFLVNTVVGEHDNAPIEVTLGWSAGVR